MSDVAIRVPLVEPGTRPELAATEARILAERGRISVLYRALLNSEPLANGWEAMLTAIRNRSSVPADVRELVILRVAVLNRAQFEFDAHVPHAQKAGVSDAQIEAVRGDLQAFDWAPELLLALQLTDSMTRDVQVSSAIMDQITATMAPKQVVELVATVAAYNMVSRFLVALNISH